MNFERAPVPNESPNSVFGTLPESHIYINNHPSSQSSNNAQPGSGRCTSCTFTIFHQRDMAFTLSLKREGAIFLVFATLHAKEKKQFGFEKAEKITHVKTKCGTVT